jgi:hypothetical protein
LPCFPVRGKFLPSNSGISVTFPFFSLPLDWVLLSSCVGSNCIALGRRSALPRPLPPTLLAAMDSVALFSRSNRFKFGKGWWAAAILEVRGLLELDGATRWRGRLDKG